MVILLLIQVNLVKYKQKQYKKQYKQYLIFLFSMNIKIDNRETELIKLLDHVDMIKEREKHKITIEIVALPIGDIILEYVGKEIIIIERKSASDLEASIKDGRYEEQSYRLTNSTVHNHNIVYLIEGVLINKPNKQMLYSAMFSLNYSKGFSVLRSASIQETAYMISNMAYKLNKNMLENKLSYYKNKEEKKEGEKEGEKKEREKEGEKKGEKKEGEEDEEKDEDKKENISYCSVVKKVKKENITPENIGEIMLCQIPSISSVSAIALMSQFKTISHLIASLKTDSTCLNLITYKNAKGQSRKLGKNIIANIIKFLL